MTLKGWRGTASAIPAYFALKIVAALALIKFSSQFLPVRDFTIFSQLFLFSALVASVSAGGVQTGLVREAAAAADDTAVEKAMAAALSIWLGACVLIGLPLILASGLVADVLADRQLAAAPLIAIVAMTMLSGCGQTFCAVLTGRGRGSTSLIIQGVSLIVGTTAALFCLYLGRAVAAGVAFAAGPVVTAVLAWAAVRSMHYRLYLARIIRDPEVVEMLRYGAAYLVLAAFSPAILFGVRYAYREAFGVEALGYWLVANRISDMTTQMLGLFMVQVFLPAFSGMADSPARDRFVVRSWAMATAMMLGFLGAFSVAPAFFVTTFLSPAFLPAQAGIFIYMIGDTFRASTSLAMHASFARARLWRFVAIEVATVSLFAVIALTAMAFGADRAPQLAYCAAYIASALVVGFSYLRSRRILASSAD